MARLWRVSDLEELVGAVTVGDGVGFRGFPFTCSPCNVFERKKILKNQFTFFKKNMITCLFESINYNL